MSLKFRALNRKNILNLLQEIYSRLHKKHIKGSITIYGGAAMLYHRNDNDYHVTRDIDASFYPTHKILKIIDEISNDKKFELNGLEKWFNNNIVQSGLLPKHSDKKSIKLYSDDTFTIYVASKEYLLAMKVISMTDRGREKDFDDAQWLCSKLNIHNIVDLENIVNKYWSLKQLKNWNMKYVKSIWQKELTFKI